MYFSVRNQVKIGGKVYKTCVCYKTENTVIMNTIENLAEKDLAVIYEEKRYFCNGKLVKTSAEKEAEEKARKKAERKAKKEVAEEKEEIVLEDATEETEGF